MIGRLHNFVEDFLEKKIENEKKRKPKQGIDPLTLGSKPALLTLGYQGTCTNDKF